jgi:hypothetical protein
MTRKISFLSRYRPKRKKSLNQIGIERKYFDKQKVLKIIDEEIDYLENHVLKANEGIKINVERVQSWIFEAKKIKQMTYSHTLKG